MLDTTELGIDWGAIEAVVSARHGEPFAILGPHDGSVRAFIPDADTVTVVDRDTGLQVGELARLHPAGFFAGPVSTHGRYLLRIGQGGSVWETEDPYSFPPILGEMDIYLLGEGRHRDLGRALGAHPSDMEGVPGVRFAVWAPNAQRVSVVGDFNGWDGRRHPMRKRQSAGVWELFIPRIAAGELYKYELLGPWGELLPLKADPVAWAAQIAPQTASSLTPGRTLSGSPTARRGRLRMRLSRSMRCMPGRGRRRRRWAWMAGTVWPTCWCPTRRPWVLLISS
jgi:1,4-alpha-glucan branching enzyme